MAFVKLSEDSFEKLEIIKQELNSATNEALDFIISNFYEQKQNFYDHRDNTYSLTILDFPNFKHGTVDCLAVEIYLWACLEKESALLQEIENNITSDQHLGFLVQTEYPKIVQKL